METLARRVRCGPREASLMKRRIRGMGIAILLFLVVGGPYAAWPRRVSLRRFDADVVAAREARMWRQYYEHRHGALVWELYRLNRGEYGFSPMDSLRMAVHAGRAAVLFQPSRSRAEAGAASGELERYFSILSARGDRSFDASEAARHELDWWQLRREGAAPDRYGRVMARVEAEIYGVDERHLVPSAVRRAEMMEYRDRRRDGAMAEADWERIRLGLAESYRLLAEVVNGGAVRQSR